MEELEIILEEETDGEEEINLESEGKLIYPSLENLEITPSKEQQIFTHKNSYGYDKVTVDPISDEYIIPTGTLDITENGEHNVKDYEKVVTDIHEVSKYKPKYISFYDCQETELDEELANLDTSNIKSMSQMFYGCSKITTLDLSTYNTNNVVSISRMFYGCRALSSIDLSSFNTSKVTDMSSMFKQNDSLTTLDLSNFDTSNVAKMESLFYYCKKLSTLNVSNFNTSKVTNMSNMFQECSSLTTLDLSNFNTFNVNQMTQMFYKCTSLESIDLSNFIMSKLTYANQMFYDCTNLKSINLSSFTSTTSTTLNMSQMFYNCTSLEHLDIRNLMCTKIKTYTNMFYGVPANCEIIVKDDEQRNWVLTQRSDFTNVKTVAEL